MKTLPKIVFMALVFILIFSVSCLNTTPAANPPLTTYAPSTFNMVFKYGVTQRNELNTYYNTFTKDMITDPPVTTTLTLTQEDKDRIYRKMMEMGFLNYPTEFTVTPLAGEPVGMVTPCSSYYFEVEYSCCVKTLTWADCITNKDSQADKLRELINLIISIIESKEEYKKLPPAQGGYD